MVSLFRQVLFFAGPVLFTGAKIERECAPVCSGNFCDKSVMMRTQFFCWNFFVGEDSQADSSAEDGFWPPLPELEPLKHQTRS
jgi:hypothetical protein